MYDLESLGFIKTYHIQISSLGMEIVIYFRAWATGTGNSTGPKVILRTHPLYTFDRNTNLMQTCLIKSLIENGKYPHRFDKQNKNHDVSVLM